MNVRSKCAILLIAAWCDLSGCSNLVTTATKAALSGGPDVIANGQAGRTNTQTIGQTNNTDLSLIRPKARKIEQSTGETGVRAEAVDQVVVNHRRSFSDLAVLIGLAFAVGLLIPSPWRRIAQTRPMRAIQSITRKENGGSTC